MQIGRSGRARHVLALLVLWTLAAPAFADRTLVAVAANFTAAGQELATAFAADSGHQAVLAYGSTGKLYTQIAHGAPYDVFLAADRERPRRAVAEGHAVPGTQFTYATGRIALYSADPDLVDEAGAVLRQPQRFARLAIANPDTAPYGAAAMSVLRALALEGTLAPRLVRGDSIAQTYQFVATGNAALGFVALSQLSGVSGGSRWTVPASLHPALHQDAVLLQRGAGSEAARSFLRFLRGPQARAIIERYGYGFGGDAE